jgi:hypothetical protein
VLKSLCEIDENDKEWGWMKKTFITAIINQSVSAFFRLY